MLRQCVLDADDDRDTPDEVKQRVAEMLSFLETLSAWYDQVAALPKPTLITLMKMGSKVAKVVGRAA